MFRKKSSRNSLEYRFKRNASISAKEVRVIGSDGAVIGIMSVQEALKRAQHEGLDLVEIAPNASPPVCKIISWSKFKYEQSKKAKSASNKGSQEKEMWFKPTTGSGDLDHKLKKIREFLAEKNKVRITIKPSRNWKLEKSFYFDQINKIIEKLSDVAEVVIPPKEEGRNVYAIIKGRR